MERLWLFYEKASESISRAEFVAYNLLEKFDEKHDPEQQIIRDAAHDLCIVSYCSPFMSYRENDDDNAKVPGLSKKHIVPTELLKMHEEIFTYRCKVLAHTDIGYLDVFGYDYKTGWICSDAETEPDRPSLKKSHELFSAVSAVVEAQLNEFKK